MIMYLLKLNIALILLFSFYKLMFTGDTFFSWRRATLIGMYFVAMMLPVMDFSAWLSNSEGMTSIANEYATVVLPAVSTSSQGGEVLLWELVVLIVYGVVTCVLLLRFLWQLVSIILLRNNSQSSYICDTEVYLLTDDEGPFSFFDWIFINPERHKSDEIEEIMMHELTHCQQLHSIDIIFSELFCIIFWFNPFVWLLKREVRLNLEYLADNSVLANGKDNKEYQYHLLGLTYRKNVATITNNFNVLPIKKRIKMMNKKETKGILKAKYALYIPLVAMLLAVSNLEAIARNVAKVTASVEIQQKPKKAPNQVYTVAEVMPTFKGNLNKWLSENLRYPKDAVSRKEQGRVMVSFIVTDKGEVIKPEIVRSVSPSLDKEALRVVSKMPAWNPGRNGNKKVATKYTLPVHFSLGSK
ncbi:M56 family metallopeptidase [Prevotella melaninogenica]